jgi:hypothetical protein
VNAWKSRSSADASIPIPVSSTSKTSRPGFPGSGGASNVVRSVTRPLSVN